MSDIIVTGISPLVVQETPPSKTQVVSPLIPETIEVQAQKSSKNEVRTR